MLDQGEENHARTFIDATQGWKPYPPRGRHGITHYRAINNNQLIPSLFLFLFLPFLLFKRQLYHTLWRHDQGEMQYPILMSWWSAQLVLARLLLSKRSWLPWRRRCQRKSATRLLVHPKVTFAKTPPMDLYARLLHHIQCLPAFKSMATRSCWQWLTHLAFMTTIEWTSSCMISLAILNTSLTWHWQRWVIIMLGDKIREPRCW